MIKTITIVVLALLVAGAFYQLSIKPEQVDLSSYQARKEDLLLRQEQLATSLKELNITVQKEMSRQDSLAKSVAALSKEASTPITVVTVPTAQPTPVVAPIPRPRTRAS